MTKQNIHLKWGTSPCCD